MKIKEILNYYNIKYSDSGKNVQEQNIYINCPFCRGDDPSYHLGINLNSGLFGCWREQSHKGTFEKLLKELLQLQSYIEAKNIIEDFNTPNNEISFYDTIRKKLNSNTVPVIKEKEIIKPQKELIFPKYFKRINKNDPFYNYLKSRNFSDLFLETIIKENKLFYCFASPDNKWNNRIIFPLYFNNSLVCWIGRSINTYSNLRYENLEKEKSILTPKEILYDYDNINTVGDFLFVSEGIIDSLKLRQFFGTNKIKSTCLFTKRVSNEQKNLLLNLSKKYKKLILILDKKEIQSTFKLKEELGFINNLKPFFLEKFNDPGEINTSDVYSIKKVLNF